ncbi:MAG: F0F1 ATP synthase subunit B, partial [Promicromonosporaceae bacterium]|nr:F0F1 ATP synthase subunit B [Promicromonosporaceae bacterium]
MITATEPTTPQGLDLFLPSWDDLLWSFVVIAIIAVAFYKWILPPLLKVLDERREAITGGIEQATRAREAADQARAEQNKILTQARADAAAMRDQARAESKQIRDD